MSAYLDRMKELQATTQQSNFRQSMMAKGLPLHRPGSDEPVIAPYNGESPKPEEDESYKNSHFYMNFDYHRNNDPHFDSMVGELTHLSSALRDQVQQGYMPARLARQRVIQYVTDTMSHYQRNEPQIQSYDKAKQTQQLQGAFMQQMADSAMASQQQSQPVPPPDPQALQASYMEQVKNVPVTSSSTTTTTNQTNQFPNQNQQAQPQQGGKLNGTV